MSDLYSVACLLALVGSAVAIFRPRLSPAFPIAAAIGWIAVLGLIVTDPPFGLAVGDAVQQIMMLACIVLAIAFGATALLVPTTSRQRLDENFHIDSESFHFPTWMGGKDPMEEERERRSSRSRSMTNEQKRNEYRMKLRGKLRR